MSATNIRKTTTVHNVKEHYTDIKQAARKLKQLVKEVRSCLLPSPIVILLIYHWLGWQLVSTKTSGP